MTNVQSRSRERRVADFESQRRRRRASNCQVSVIRDTVDIDGFARSRKEDRTGQLVARLTSGVRAAAAAADAEAQTAAVAREDAARSAEA